MTNLAIEAARPLVMRKWPAEQSWGDWSLQAGYRKEPNNSNLLNSCCFELGYL